MCIWSSDEPNEVLNLREEDALVGWKTLQIRWGRGGWALGLQSPHQRTSWPPSGKLSADRVTEQNSGIYVYAGRRKASEYEPTYVKVKVWGTVYRYSGRRGRRIPWRGRRTMASGTPGFRAKHCQILEIHCRPAYCSLQSARQLKSKYPTIPVYYGSKEIT